MKTACAMVAYNQRQLSWPTHPLSLALPLATTGGTSGQLLCQPVPVLGQPQQQPLAAIRSWDGALPPVPGHPPGHCPGRPQSAAGGGPGLGLNDSRRGAAPGWASQD